MYVYVYECPCVRVCVRVCMCMSVHMCMRVCMCMRICMCMCMFMCICMCMYGKGKYHIERAATLWLKANLLVTIA